MIVADTAAGAIASAVSVTALFRSILFEKTPSETPPASTSRKTASVASPPVVLLFARAVKRFASVKVKVIVLDPTLTLVSSGAVSVIKATPDVSLTWNFVASTFPMRMGSLQVTTKTPVP